MALVGRTLTMGVGQADVVWKGLSMGKEEHVKSGSPRTHI